jgi:hypothetical protein
MMIPKKKVEEWEGLETDLHKRMYMEYVNQREKNELTHESSVLVIAEAFLFATPEIENIAKTMHWRERYEKDFVSLPVDTSQWTKDDYRKFVKDAVESVNIALKGVKLENGINNSKDMKSAVDALEKLTRLDLTLMGEASEHIAIDVFKRPDQMTDDELAAALMQLQKKLPAMRTEKEEMTTDGDEEGDAS